ncbi:hypothetical protein FACS189411_07220 [Bacteroidia bacterium]|nr:hypothetical protein FACS189411_07220 [Bacteroidia bacterium]
MDMAFCEEIRKLREKRKKTQKQMAGELKINIAIYRKIEKGERQATQEQVLIIAQFLQISEQELIDLWQKDQNSSKNVQTQDNEMNKKENPPEPKG